MSNTGDVVRKKRLTFFASYIVDFEDYSVLTPEWSGERSWSDDEYKYSRLSEDCKPHPDARYL